MTFFDVFDVFWLEMWRFYVFDVFDILTFFWSEMWRRPRASKVSNRCLTSSSSEAAARFRPRMSKSWLSTKLKQRRPTTLQIIRLTFQVNKFMLNRSSKPSCEISLQYFSGILCNNFLLFFWMISICFFFFNVEFLVLTGIVG